MIDKPILRLKTPELVAAEHDRIIPIASYQALLPCRNFEVGYKVAVLSSLSPTLEFFLRLVKAVPGISLVEAASFFGYSEEEIAYVVGEAATPGYVEVEGGKAFMTNAGEALFTISNNEPLVSQVKAMRRTIGFDLYSVSPERKVPLKPFEQMLPELPLIDGQSLGREGSLVPGRFKLLFREIADHADRDQMEKSDLYSIDDVDAGERFACVVPIVAAVRASAPSRIESVDLSGWRPQFQLQDRQQVETSAFRFVSQIERTKMSMDADAAYDMLLEAAPQFLQDYRTRDGLSVRRYWGDALRRAGEPRKDRPTIPMVGALDLRENVLRILRIFDFGLDRSEASPAGVAFVAPQLPHWATSAAYPGLVQSMSERSRGAPEETPTGFASACIHAGEPEKHLEKMFRQSSMAAGVQVFPRSVEVMLVPKVMVALLVHAPIGVPSGFPVPLGLASFDREVVDFIEGKIVERVDLDGLLRGSALQ